MTPDAKDDSLAAINEAWAKGWPKVVARAWIDEAFRQRLLADPNQVAAELGLPLLYGVKLKVVEGAAEGTAESTIDVPTMVISLPKAPADLAEESMNVLAQSSGRAEDCAGTSCCC